MSGERLQEAMTSSKEMIRPTVHDQLVTLLVSLPCPSFQGVESRMFSPVVITLMLVLASAFVLSITFMPAILAVVMTKHVKEREIRVTQAIEN